VVGLLAVSERTTLTTLSDNVQHSMHWLPLPLGLVLTALSFGVVGSALWRARGLGEARARIIERRALFLVAVPVAIFLSTAVLPGGVGVLNTFESGQEIATLRLLHLGEVPYRDFLPFHGLLADTLFSALGYKLLSPSFWGTLAGMGVVVTPLTWVALYLFAYRVAGSSWAAMVTVVLLIFNTTLVALDTRLIMWPLILLLLAVALDRRSRFASFCTGAAAVAFAVLVPEATYAVPACGLAILVRDAYQAGWPRVRAMRDFSLTLSAILGGAVVLAALFILLAAEHAVGGFVDFYVTQVPGHGLEGAIPISLNPMTQQFGYWIVAPAAAVLLAVGILAVRVRLRLPLRTNDFLMIAAASFAVLYYANEFLGRADPPHAEVAYGGAIPVLMLCAWDVVSWLNVWLRARLRGGDSGHHRHHLRAHPGRRVTCGLPGHRHDRALALQFGIRRRQPAADCRRRRPLPFDLPQARPGDLRLQQPARSLLLHPRLPPRHPALLHGHRPRPGQPERDGRRPGEQPPGVRHHVRER
jgi:hypothetical protein